MLGAGPRPEGHTHLDESKFDKAQVIHFMHERRATAPTWDIILPSNAVVWNLVCRPLRQDMYILLVGEPLYLQFVPGT